MPGPASPPTTEQCTLGSAPWQCFEHVDGDRSCNHAKSQAQSCVFLPMERVCVLARHLLCTAPVSSVAVAVDIDAIVDTPGDEAPRLIALAQLAKEGEISAQELLVAKLKVLGVVDAPVVNQSAVSGSEYVELDSDAGQSLLEACTSDREREWLYVLVALPLQPSLTDAGVRSC
eukprot:COSAG02_NODE_661_length_18757_cov_4.427699_18_plen_174_part_00